MNNNFTFTSNSRLKGLCIEAYQSDIIVLNSIY